MLPKKKTQGPKKKSWQEWFLADTPLGRYIGCVPCHDILLVHALPLGELFLSPSHARAHTVTNQTLKTLNKATNGKYPAPYKAFESIMNATKEKNIDKARARSALTDSAFVDEHSLGFPSVHPSRRLWSSRASASRRCACRRSPSP